MEGLPSIYDFLQFLNFLRGDPAAYIVLGTASMILILRDWRWSLLFLLIQYLVAGLLLADVIVAHFAFTRVLIGVFICLILYITARQVGWGHLPEDLTEEEANQLSEERLIQFGVYSLPMDIPFRIFLALLIALSMWEISHRIEVYALSIPPYIIFAAFSLVGLGIVTAALTSEPMKSGMGILTFIIGFEILYTAIGQSPGTLALTSIAMLAVAVAIAYLIQTSHNFRAFLR